MNPNLRELFDCSIVWIVRLEPPSINDLSAIFSRQIPRDLVDTIRLIDFRNDMKHLHSVSPTFGQAIKIRPRFSARDIPSYTILRAAPNVSFVTRPCRV